MLFLTTICNNWKKKKKRVPTCQRRVDTKYPPSVSLLVLHDDKTIYVNEFLNVTKFVGGEGQECISDAILGENDIPHMYWTWGLHYSPRKLYVYYFFNN